MQKTTPKVKILAGFFLTASVIAFVVGIALIIITHNFWWVFLPATGLGGFLGTLSGMSDRRRLTHEQAQRLGDTIEKD